MQTSRIRIRRMVTAKTMRLTKANMTRNQIPRRRRQARMTKRTVTGKLQPKPLRNLKMVMRFRCRAAMMARMSKRSWHRRQRMHRSRRSWIRIRMRRTKLRKGERRRESTPPRRGRVLPKRGCRPTRIRMKRRVRTRSTTMEARTKARTGPRIAAKTTAKMTTKNIARTTLSSIARMTRRTRARMGLKTKRTMKARSRLAQ
mmetsp:Transcript_64000/g.125964  ORF Transcript_64000/g.125964 Transcript_64000/m.125964 type:complete len:201 (+) Transcript_64000:295-897(+)